MRTSKHGLSVLLVFLLGCSSLTPERINILAQIAGQAAQFGAQEWLKDHPDQRLAFEAVIASITALVKQGETREFKYSELLQSLPAPTLAGPDGAVYVTGTSKLSTDKEQDRIIVYDELTKKPYHVGGDIRVQRQIVAGLKRAMLPMPPVPGKAKVRSGPTNQVFTHNPPEPVVVRSNVVAPVKAVPPKGLIRKKVTK